MFAYFARPERRKIATALGVALITFAVFVPALRNQFVNWDDPDNILLNEHFRGLDPARLHWMFTATHGGHYQPLSWVTLGLDYLWGRAVFGDGLDPRSYHLTSCLLHAASAALVYLLAWRLLAAACRSAWAPRFLNAAAVLAALLFALHPLRAESVAWVTERRDVLSSFFALLTVLLYVSAPTAPGVRRWKWLGLALAVFTLSLLSRSLGVVLPPILLLLDWYPLRRFERRPGAVRSAVVPALLEKLPFFVLAAMVATIAVRAQGDVGAAYDVGHHSPLARVVQACYGLCFYLGKTVVPLGLAPIYELRLPLDVFAPRYIIALVLVLAGLAALLALAVAGRGHAILVASGCYVLLILPVSGLVQSGKQEVADRYSYLPGVVLAIVLAGGALRVWSAARTPARMKRGLAVGAVGVCLVLAGLTWHQCGTWRDSTTLWARAARVQPDSAIAQNCYGVVLLEQKRFDEALVHFRRAVELWPAYGLAHLNLWRVLEQTGRKEELLADVRQTVALYPRYAEAHYELARNLAESGQADAALEEYGRTLALRPDHSQAHTNLAYMLRQRGRTAEALAHYQAATAADGRNLIAWLGWADLLHSLGRDAEALDALRVALEIAPSDARARQLWQACSAGAPVQGAPASRP